MLRHLLDMQFTLTYDQAIISVIFPMFYLLELYSQGIREESLVLILLLGAIL